MDFTGPFRLSELIGLEVSDPPMVGSFSADVYRQNGTLHSSPKKCKLARGRVGRINQMLARSSAQGSIVLMAATAVTISTVMGAEAPQSNNYTTFEVTGIMPVQLGYYASAKNDCTLAPLPTVRIIEAPKVGSLIVRRGTITTGKEAACPDIKMPAQIAFYRARPNASGKDHLIYEVTTFTGGVNVYDVTIDIKPLSKP